MRTTTDDAAQKARRQSQLPASGPLLVAAEPGEDGSARPPLSKLHVLAVLGRRSLPRLIEATVVPGVLFYLFLITIGPTAAMLAALAWSYSAVARHLVRE